MKNELSKEDQERIKAAAMEYCKEYGGFWKDFRQGAIFQHEYSYEKGEKEGFNEAFNEAIEEVKKLVNKMTISNAGGEIGLSTRFFEGIEKLKK
jgi:flagellar biosynthesis/type III secretory pathway protein FliH